MRGLLVWILFGGLALAGFESYLEMKWGHGRGAKAPAESGGSGDVTATDGGNGMPPCCN